MTVADENEAGDSYMTLQFVEFLEMLGRIAEVKFYGTPQLKNWTLAERLEIILDSILPTVGYSRVQIDMAALEDTESDNEY